MSGAGIAGRRRSPDARKSARWCALSAARSGKVLGIPRTRVASVSVPAVLDTNFWSAIERLVSADDAGEDVASLAADLLEADASLGAQLEEAVCSLNGSALAEAADLSDGGSASEDAMIAVGCAVIASGPAVFAEAVADPKRLVRPWDLSRGDLLLVLNPALRLADGQAGSRREPYTINLSIGDSSFGWPRPITEAVTHHYCRRQEKNPRWRAIFTRHAVEHLIVHLSVAPGRPQKVGTPTKRHEGYLEVAATWDPPRSPLRLPAFTRTVLDAVATSLERS